MQAQTSDVTFYYVMTATVCVFARSIINTKLA